MCGIAACFSSDIPVSEDALKRATAALHHRGPDNQRQWLSPDGRVGLGHSRLSIIDLSGGDQPIASEDERLHIVVNGEFYDFERIRRELESRGHRFRTHSDSEIALHLYEDVGVHCLPQLRGEFAFALWDANNQTLFAARDRFGIKPLFYAHHEGVLYIASEAKALFAAGVPARWDHEGFYQGITGFPSPERTLFEGVFQVPVSLKIRGMTEKHILREATRSVITDTVYRREKHPFLSPPVTTLPGERFHEMMQDTLRGQTLRSLRFYDQKRVVALLDTLPTMSDGVQVVWDQVLMSILSACVLHERFKL